MDERDERAAASPRPVRNGNPTSDQDEQRADAGQVSVVNQHADDDEAEVDAARNYHGVDAPA